MTCEELGDGVCELAGQPLPSAVQSATERALLNVTTAAIAASRNPVVDTIVRLAGDHGGAGTAPVPGRPELVDMYFSALAAGAAASAISPDARGPRYSATAAPFGTLVALAATEHVTGRNALTAFALGCEVVVRLADALLPQHDQAGWDASATCGVIGAAVCGALLLHADAAQVTNAIGIAVSETLGQRRALESEIGTLHTGKAASNGLIAALLSRQGFTGLRGLNHPDGFFTAFPLPAGTSPDSIVSGLGERWFVLDHSEFQFAPRGTSDAVFDAITNLQNATDAGTFVDALATGKGPAVA